MDKSRFRFRSALVALAVVGISAALLYFGGDHRAGLTAVGESVFLACLVYSAWRRDRARKS
jgi:hypothetical protein